MNRNRGFTLALCLSALALLFQNCSGASFEEAPDTASKTNIPICRDTDADAAKPRLKWDWKSKLAASPAPRFETMDQVMGSPMVADLNGDGAPEVVFVTFSMKAEDWYADTPNTSGYVRNGVLRIVNAATGATIKSVAGTAISPLGSQTPLLMDIDGDGKVEIFYMHYLRKKLIALNHDGSHRWTYDTPQLAGFATTGLTGSDVNNNGFGEVLVGNQLISEDLSRRPFLQKTLDQSTSTHTTSLAYPLDPSKPNQMNLVAYLGIFRPDGSKVASFEGGYYFAAADLFPEVPGVEVISTGGQTLYVFNGLTGATLRKVSLLEYDELFCRADVVGGGPPSIGDFDGDEATLEIAVATGRHLTIFDRDLKPKYKTVTQDCSSLSTGLTTFDLNGDKKPEILYADEERFRIFEVRNGQLEIIHSFVNPTGTLQEYPVVADLTGKGDTGILVIANNYPVTHNNPGFYGDAGEAADKIEAAGITGVRAFESTEKKAWMPTRPIWNQHSFHPDLVSDKARPLISPKVDSKMFRRNNQGNAQTLECIKE